MVLLSIIKSVQLPVLDCAQLQLDGATESGLFKIFVNGRGVNVLCDFETSGGGWIVSTSSVAALRTLVSSKLCFITC